MDEDREGCSPFVVTEDNVNIVEKLVLQDQRITVKQLSSETGISLESFELIHNDNL